MSSERKDAFIIMPYGKRRAPKGREVLDFDRVYKEVIYVAVDKAGFNPVRSDEIMKAGSIHKEMFKHLAKDDVAIVDITMLNPNVFYEIGIRHALKPSITVLIKKRGWTIPFNIQSERVIEYPDEAGSYDETRNSIQKFIQAGIKSIEPDSPIFNLLQDVQKDPKAASISRVNKYLFSFNSQPTRQIGIITGDLTQSRNIDVWVNSENTNMQMSRYYDKSLSATIRYEGAEKDENDEVIEDTIGNQLVELLKGRQLVQPGTVFVTSAGSLTKTRGVKKIFHAATVIGVPGSGYHAMKDIERCITNALRRMDNEHARGENLRSIVFPMMGTGQGGGKVKDVAPRLIQTAISYLLNNPESWIETIYFSAWNTYDLEACTAALDASNDLTKADIKNS